MFSVVSLVVLSLLRTKSALAFSQCYYPDGSIPTDYVWEPCTGAQYSSCCVPSEGDVCQENGLCYYPPEELVYRGACTDQTWKDPACNVDKCVSGFETTWQWVGECVASGSTTTVCGSYSDSAHATPTCAAPAALNTVYVSTTSTTSAHIYSAPPSIDTARFSVETDTYTTIITADAQTTTLTSTFESTKTNTLSSSTSSGTSSTATTTAAGNSIATGSSNTTTNKKTVTISIGALVGIVVGILLAIAIGIALFFFFRRKRQVFGEKIGDKQNTAPPPPNGPVGKDQVYPYEAPVNETSLPTKNHTYASPRIDAYEMDNMMAGSNEKRDANVVEMYADGGTNEKRGAGVVEVHADGDPKSPAPMYHELDGHSNRQ